MNITEDSLEINGQKLTLQFGKLAQLVDQSVYATLGGTAVLVTVAIGPENPAIDYFPLSVEYVEKLYAGGLIKGSRWVKREGRPSDEAVLTGRVIDRSVRPLFPKAYKKQVQVVATLLSVDGINPPDVLAAIAVSAALAASSVPWDGPISTSRVGLIENDLMVNPDQQTQRASKLDLVVSSSKDKVVMIETQAEMIDDAVIQEGIELAKKENAKIIDFIQGLVKKVGKTKGAIPEEESFEEIMPAVSKYEKQLAEYIHDAATHEEREGQLNEIIDAIYTDLEEKVDKKKIAAAVQKYTYKQIKTNILEKKQRPDGRKFNEYRALFLETSILPRTHGSAIFQRGQTQILSVVTLGSTTLEQLIEGPEGQEAKRYMHHYSDGPYSYGQAGRIGTPSRRAIGHGALAEKGVEPVLPTTEEFPYAIRVVSEILAENGSSSMGSISGSSLALMDAGVPLKAPVAGIAMGIVAKNDDEYAILTDIVGVEDFSGEMDFKVAGTTEGVTAIQLDVKSKGLTAKMIKEIFAQAKEARLGILAEMNKVISTARKDISQYAPKVVILTPPQDKIGEIIGPGGRNIKALIARTQTEINISDDGKVTISGIDKAGVDAAVDHIASLTREVKVGEQFDGEVVRMLPFGAFVEILPGKDGMIHVSKMGRGFVKDPSQVVSIGQKVKVEVIQIDEKGRINLQLLDENGNVPDNGGSEGGGEYRPRSRPDFRRPRPRRDR